MSRQRVIKWCHNFASGKQRMTFEVDDEHSRRLNSKLQRRGSNSTLQKRDLGLMASDLSLSFNTSEHSSHCARRLSHAVTENITASMVPVSCSCNILPHRNDICLCWLVTDDEIWVRLSTPTAKQPDMLWKSSNLPTRKNRVLIAFLWNPLGLFGGGLSVICTRNSHMYCATQKNLGQTIKRKHLGIISVGVAMPDRSGHSRLRTCCTVRFGKSCSTPHMVQIWDLPIIICLPPDRALVRKSFHPRFCRLQTCYRHVGEATVLWVGMDKTITRCDKCLNRQGDCAE